jgi:hypothetical protein
MKVVFNDPLLMLLNSVCEGFSRTFLDTFFVLVFDAVLPLLEAYSDTTPIAFVHEINGDVVSTTKADCPVSGSDTLLNSKFCSTVLAFVFFEGFDIRKSVNNVIARSNTKFFEAILIAFVVKAPSFVTKQLNSSFSDGFGRITSSNMS